MENENQQGVGKAEEKVAWELYTMHYPFSGERIPMVRALNLSGNVYVTEVARLKSRKLGKVIAEGDLRNGPHGLYINTTPDHWGHLALCRFLLRAGIGGRYKMWLKAKDEGNEELAREYQDTAYIRFSLKLTDEKKEDWIIDTHIEDGGTTVKETESPGRPE